MFMQVRALSCEQRTKDTNPSDLGTAMIGELVTAWVAKEEMIAASTILEVLR